ncbi:MAG: hypothetical protein ACREGG_04700 [Candidatus Saccharimonadales bacterium]
MHKEETAAEKAVRISRAILMKDAEIALCALEAHDAAKKAVRRSQESLENTFAETPQEVIETLSLEEREIIERAQRSLAVYPH